jgi:hypothetical protein
MLYDQPQYISLKKLKCSANRLAGFLIKAHANRQGKIPKTKNRITPGIRKSLKGEWSRIDKGNPFNNFPDGEMMSNAPPPIAPNPSNNNNEISMFLMDVGFIFVLIITI